ncbi:uncharacterized protein JN550_004439 [Neoarthrinium moseri]|uniref:uncharacterized protein n=1 Tax=Neoarthrinium moseri TaxID=1658444 RepID=UPI001FDB8A07|nr:uncharacterized protein JN550_004439 [Neoarthrinium moseri]KAI1871445.1 hypothetical protein JN550_004439 [Neoarthrinium moseri]
MLSRLSLRHTVLSRQRISIEHTGLMLTSPINSRSRQGAPAAWLKQLIDDDSAPPKLFAWTTANLSPGSTPLSNDNTRLKSQSHTTPLERIYILGIGNLGRLFASSLARLPKKPPITLVVHRKSLLEQWASSPGIEITRHGKVERTSDFDVEWWTHEKPPAGPILEPTSGAGITNLIVATKASDALPQVDRLRGYLGRDSTVTFVQNGMCKLWPPMGDLYLHHRFPDLSGPSWVACVTTHGVTSLAPFKSIHASPANVSVGPVSLNPESGGSAQYLMNQIADAPDLSGQIVSKADLWVLQLEKLVVNSTINPLTAILGCKNGELFIDREDRLPLIIKTLVHEAGLVLTSLVSDVSSADILNDESNGSPLHSREGPRDALIQRLSSTNLLTMLYEVGYKVRENTSSMLQDVRAGKKTEIRDFNGWLVETARFLDLGSAVPTHEKLIKLVENGASLSRDELCDKLISSSQ